jgi:hypothetical protein
VRELSYRYVITLLLSYLIVIFLGHGFVRIVLKKFPLKSEGFKYAGAVIGFLERFLILTLILVGEHMSIGLILAAKSIARFEELKDRKFSEYFLIGTLSSISIAVGVGIITVWVLKRM